MTADDLDALEQLLHEICAATTSAAFAEHWPGVRPSERQPRGFSVDLSAGPFSTIEFNTWGPTSFGIVDVELRDDGTWSWASIASRFGPFETDVVGEGGEVRRYADWRAPGLPATAILQGAPDGDRIAAVTIQRQPGAASSADPVRS